MSENPVVSIIARLLVMQFNNAAVVHRLSKARDLEKLPRTQNAIHSRDYTHPRHEVTQLESFGKFARFLAQE